ncbi:MAG: helix-turn-helix transcriptional regulator [Chloroflexi bacterium]|nr:helix-turn-helix transcriptional regulator [Chloroflexota bacterium]
MMNSKKAKEMLSRLTETERKVLEVYCKGTLTYWQIGEELNMAVGTVKPHMSVIFSKLELSGLQRHIKKQRILEDFCPALESSELEPPPPEPEVIHDLSEEEEKEVDELEFPLEVVEPEVLTLIDPPTTSRPWSCLSRIAFGVLSALIGALLLYIALDSLGLIGEPDGADALISQGAEGANVTQIPVTVIISPTPLPPQPTQTSVVELQTVIVVASPLPTSIPTLTPQPLSIEEYYAQNLPIPIEAGTLLLEDDFSIKDTWDTIDGFYDEEQILLHDRGTQDFYFSHARPHLSFDNIILEVDGYWSDGSIGGKYGLGFRFQDQDNYYEFLISNDGRYSISKYVNGFVTVFLEGYSEAIALSGVVNRFHVEVNGNTKRFFINGQYLGSIEDGEFPSGDVCLMADTPESTQNLYIAFDNLLLALHP